jgi:hypothetical protein
MTSLWFPSIFTSPTLLHMSTSILIHHDVCLDYLAFHKHGSQPAKSAMWHMIDPERFPGLQQRADGLRDRGGAGAHDCCGANAASNI